MNIIVVLVLGVAAGIGVYAVSMRWDRSPPAVGGEGFLPEDERRQTEALQASAGETSMRPAGGAYVPLATGTRSAQTRLLGLLGIVVLVPIAAVVFAVTAYGVGQIVVETITRLIQNAST